MRNYLSIVVIALFSVLILSGMVSAETASSTEQAETTRNTRETITYVEAENTVSSWMVHDDDLFWNDHEPCLIRADSRSPADENVRVYVAGTGHSEPPESIYDLRNIGTTTNVDCGQFQELTVDRGRLYFIDKHAKTILVRSASPYVGFGEKLVANDAPSIPQKLAVSGDYLYWSNSNNDIMRVLKEDGTPETFVTNMPGVIDLTVHDLHEFVNGVYGSEPELYIATGNGLYYVSVDCTPLPCNPVSAETLRSTATDPAIVSTSVTSLVTARYQSELRYSAIHTLINGDERGEIGTIDCQRISNSAESCINNILYTTVDRVNVSLGRPSFMRHGDDFHWSELASDNPTFNIFSIYRKKSGQLKELLASNVNGITDTYEVRRGAVIFKNNSTFVRISADAAPIEHTFAVDEWEITQSIQNLDGSVPLVADKPTVVRVFGSLEAGQNAVGVRARLSAYSSQNVLLPGSPLFSINGFEDLASGYVPDRGQRGGGWTFALPESWDDAGTITLVVNVDPDNVFNALVSASKSISFHVEPAACIKYIPARTAEGIPTLDSPHVGAMVDRFTTLWPIPNTRVFYDASPLGRSDWDLTSGRQQDKLIRRVLQRYRYSDRPDECQDDGGSIHYVGMVHGDHVTDGVIGYARFGPNVSWVLNPATSNISSTSWRSPREGGVLAQEVAHNFRYSHVGCGVEQDDSDYPYAECDIGDVDPRGFYGFDTISKTPIEPDEASDFMSYGRPKWVSDYTYLRVMDEFEPETRGADSAETVTPAAREISRAAAFIAIDGSVDVTGNDGELSYAFQVDSATTTRDIMHTMRDAAAEKWESPQAHHNYGPFVTEEEIPLHDHGSGRVIDASLHLQLLDVNGIVLDDRAVELIEIDDHGGVEELPFFITFPTPAGQVKTIQLMSDNVVLDSLSPGTSEPTVSISSPDGTSAFSTPFSITWQGADADPGDEIHYNVSFSYDGGTHWTSLAVDYPGDPTSSTQTLILDNPRALRSTTGIAGLIRVDASDGYNTGTAMSAAFSVGNRAPLPAIVSPGSGQQFAALEAVPLRGVAFDQEEGEAMVDWELNGVSVSAENSDTLMGLAPGDYILDLRATDSGGSQAIKRGTFSIAPLVVPTGGTPEIDGNCDESAYADGLSFPLYDSVSQPSPVTAYLMRTTDDLYLCLIGLPDVPDSNVGLRADSAMNGGALPRVDDYAFVVTNNGGELYAVGDGSVFEPSLDDIGYEAWMLNEANGFWSVEMQISAEALGGWNDLKNIMIDYNASETSLVSGNTVFTNYAWPYSAESNNPDSWGTARFVAVPLAITAGAAQASGNPATVLLLIFSTVGLSIAAIRYRRER